MVTGAAGDARMMPPEVEETISETSTNHWNAEVRAEKIFNSTISSSGGVATISVDVPVVERLPTNVVDPSQRGWRQNSIEMKGFVTFSYRTASGWQGPFDVLGNVVDGILTINDVNTAEIDQVLFRFVGRQLGDVRNNGAVTTADATTVLRYRAFLDELTPTDNFYGDVNNDGVVSTADAVKILMYRAFLNDKYYQ
jgi:hypothetical protein